MGATILIADDSPSMRQLVSYTLRSQGYEVLEACDGDQALSLLDANSDVALVVTDLHMPGVGGLDVVRGVRAREQHMYTPVVVLTTESHEDRKSEIRAAGGTGWITKPFAPEQLLAAVGRLIRSA